MTDPATRSLIASGGAYSIALCDRSVLIPSSASASIALASAISIATAQLAGWGMMFHATLRHGTSFINSWRAPEGTR